MRTLAALIISFVVASPALASHPGYYGQGPTVVVQVDAFSPDYRPAPRAGYIWIDGYYDAYGWVPGWWEPSYTRAGYAWVPGYWAGPQYVAGFWRSNVRAGHYWSAGYYNGRNFVSGGWVRGNASQYRPHPRAVAQYEHRNRYYSGSNRAASYRDGRPSNGGNYVYRSDYRGAAPRSAAPHSSANRPAPASQRPTAAPSSSSQRPSGQRSAPSSASHASTRRGVR